MIKEKLQNKLDLGTKVASIIGSREIVKSLKPLIDKLDANRVVLDFQNVEFLSRSAAHELILLQIVFATANKKKVVTFNNLSKEIEQILRTVAASRAVPSKEMRATPKTITFKVALSKF